VSSALVFDLDGTLVDSRRDLAAAVNRTRRDYGLDPLPLEEVVRRVGYGAAHLVRRATEEVGAERMHEALRRFFGHYERRLLDTTHPYPGVESMLETLATRYPLAILTNKPEGFARAVLAGLDLARHFHHVLGGDSVSTPKPDPEGLRELARRFDVSVGELLLVGDSRVDADTARAANAPFAFVTWGFADAEEREAVARETRARGGRVLTTPEALIAALSS
jgi:phosphoglycolate phosphatase